MFNIDQIAKDPAEECFPPLQDLVDETRKRFKDRQLTPEERKRFYLE